MVILFILLFILLVIIIFKFNYSNSPLNEIIDKSLIKDENQKKQLSDFFWFKLNKEIENEFNINTSPNPDK